MGGEIGSFTPSDNDLYEDTQLYNASFARCGLRPVGAATYATSAALALPDDFWVHAEIAQQDSSTSYGYPLVFVNGGTEVLRVGINANGIKIEALVSAVWTQVGSVIAVNMEDSLQTIDMSVVGNDASGSVTVYVAGTERMTATIDLSAVVSIDNLKIGPTANRRYTSQIIIADESTIGWRLATYYPSGAGATGNWTGDHTAVDEVRYSDADFIYSASADQVETYTASGPSLTGYVVRAVGVYCRAHRGASGPQNLQLAVRVNGTDYFSSSKALSLGFDSYGNIWSANPDTAVDWLTSQISAVQPGVKSIT